MQRRLVFAVLVLVGLLAPVAPAGAADPAPDRPLNLGANGPDDFPDPFFIRDGNTWYAFGTDGDLGDVQVIKSTDHFVTWSNVGTAVAKNDEPSWAQRDDVWAPAVYKAPTNFILYNAYIATATGKRCIAAHTSSTIAGGYKPTAFQLCNDAEGGVIDPDVFTTLVGSYLIWKTEGVPGSEPPALWSQPLALDGLSLTGTPTRLLSSRYPWEGTLVENPSMVAVGNQTFLFYSGNEWLSADYGVGWAVCNGPSGPCVAPPNKPLLKTEGDSLQGPGGGTVFQDENGQWWLGFAAWIDGNTNTKTGHRQLFLRKLDFGSGRPALQAANGSIAPQPLAVRVAGSDRYDTSARFSAMNEQANRSLAYVATGSAFPDALASGPASGNEGGPVFLVTRDGVPASVKAELCRVRPGHVVVMGGTGAISDATYNDAASCAVGGSAHREPGNNRYDTAARVSANTFRNGAPVAYIATGENFADALAGGAAGARNRGPLLLVQRDAVPGETGGELARLKPGRIVVLGGPGAVSDNVFNELKQYSGNVTRIAGQDRFDTSARVARAEFGSLIGGLVLATGQSFPDAVAAGAGGYPILLVPSGGPAPSTVKDALTALNPLGVLVMGGPNAVSDDTLRSLGL